MLYGMPLVVPGDLIPSSNQEPNHRAVIREMREQAAQLAPVPTTKHGNPISSFPPTLKKEKFVFVRKDKHRPPLCRPYEGPFKVLEPGEKYFKVMRQGKTEIISVDRLKSAHLDITASPIFPSKPTVPAAIHTPCQGQSLFIQPSIVPSPSSSYSSSQTICEKIWQNHQTYKQDSGGGGGGGGHVVDTKLLTIE